VPPTRSDDTGHPDRAAGNRIPGSSDCPPRHGRGAAQPHLNCKTGISQGYPSDLESGRRTGTAETIAKPARALNAPVDWLSQAASHAS